ncbi:glyoxalase [Streptomyces sp. RY43-2]|uniref:Glyoxalase n=1 Tax=Streptomyces macrolidinus TaxID=2952607 RepID=A0ABT0ZLK9_9ACTN|nr:glyoxalase [Streptomyces macrolidinus]MCN9244397.1 glyoxalase [Streptomyces macrolidinus]
MRKRVLSCFLPIAATTGLLTGQTAPAVAHAPSTAVRTGSRTAVGTQYNTTHVYVRPGTMPAFAAAWKATFGGTSTAVSVTDVTPTPSRTKSQLLFSPVGTLSVFDFQTPVPYPFGAERTGWLVTSMPAGIEQARASGAKVIVSPFLDPVGRDAVIQFPGGVNTQLYWHTTAPVYKPLETTPENRVYLPPDAVSAFLGSYLKFTSGTIESDVPRADASEIGLPGQTFRRIRVTSPFGRTVVSVTNGHLPYPYGREVTGYRVANLATTLSKAKAAGATVLSGPHRSGGRDSAVVQFPGGYIAEIHDVVSG